ncbi:hypothetical protein ElyMa_003447500 [Elysia marginata]|uniref:Uncharacterized protein n=1 Tax=Elysia marginata TaxID=1093978 RepID=A0AAV4JWE9_9GAST|nr:hypothetical protein ElyMa_003447500 [Elysia marginata]
MHQTETRTFSLQPKKNINIDVSDNNNNNKSKSSSYKASNMSKEKTGTYRPNIQYEHFSNMHASPTAIRLRLRWYAVHHQHAMRLGGSEDKPLFTGGELWGIERNPPRCDPREVWSRGCLCLSTSNTRVSPTRPVRGGENGGEGCCLDLVVSEALKEVMREGKQGAGGYKTQGDKEM